MYTFKKLSILFLFTFLWSSTFNVPGDYSTIQEAINASQDGDNIVVSSGTYYENINFSFLGRINIDTWNNSKSLEMMLDDIIYEDVT